MTTGHPQQNFCSQPPQTAAACLWRLFVEADCENFLLLQIAHLMIFKVIFNGLALLFHKVHLKLSNCTENN